MKIERTKNAINGTVTGISVKVLQLVFPFVIRTIFIKTLGIEYLGLNSLFTSILQVLNLAELGVSSALVFSMYRPIAEDNGEKICQLMALYRRYYRIIGGIILIAGLLTVPILPHLIKGSPPKDINLYVIYLMNLISTVLSYWMFAYRNALFTAHQRLDIVNIVCFAVSILTYALQIAALLSFNNYYYYLSINIISQIVLNSVTAMLSKKYYPQYSPKGQLPKEEQIIINKKVRDLFTAKVGSVVNNSADALVISAFLGLRIVAVYQNYYYIVSSLMAFFSIFFTACTAGIGNSLVLNCPNENRMLLHRLNHILFAALNFCCPCLICLLQPFMKLWVGENYMLNFSYVILFAIYLFVEESPRAMLNFKDAGGIWKEDRFRPLATALTNLCLNLILVNYIGLYGVLLSTVVSFVVIGFPWLVRNINKCLFEIDIPEYCKRYCCYILVTAASSTACYFICNQISIPSAILELIIKLAVCTVVSTLFFAAVFRKREETDYIVHLMKRVLHIEDKA